MVPLMRQLAGCIVLLVLVSTVLAQTPDKIGGIEAPAEAKRQRQLKCEQMREMEAKLKATAAFPGVDDPKATFSDVLDQLAITHAIVFRVNDRAFRLDGLADVPAIPVVGGGTPLPRLKGVSLNTILRKVLSRIPNPSGATFINRGDGIEITTGDAFKAAVFLGSEQEGPLPLVCAEITKQPLDDTLKDLADEYGFNIVLDARAGEKAKTAVTGEFNFVPLDTVVRILADMANLKPVRLDNVLYVTTKENARVVAKAERRQKNAQLEKKLLEERQSKTDELMIQMQRLRAQMDRLEAEIRQSKKEK
jgi:hypothetical protein